MDVLDWIKTAGDLFVNGRNVEAQGALLEVRREVLSLQERLLERDKRVAELERERDLKQSLQYKKPSYYLTKPDGTEDGPFCQRCYDVDGKLVRQHDSKEETGLWRKCLQCKFGQWVERWPGPPKPPNQGRRWIRV